MTFVSPSDIEFLAARLHGRRSRMAEGERLDDLCRIRTVPELARVLQPDAGILTAPDLQRSRVRRYFDEIAELPPRVQGEGRELLSWLRVRFQVENLKVLTRGFANGRTLDSLRRHLVPLPPDLVLDEEGLAAADSARSFAARVPDPRLRDSLDAVQALYEEQPRPFFIEAALDRGYLAELRVRANRLEGPAREDVAELVGQEIDGFHMMLIARGIFHYALLPESLLTLHVAGSRIGRSRFLRMAEAGTLGEAVALAVGRAVDAMPAEPTPVSVEVLTWNRYQRIANRVFRRSHMGLGALVAFLALRRIELANLITVSEGLRIGVDPGALRARLLPARQLEAVHV